MQNYDKGSNKPLPNKDAGKLNAAPNFISKDVPSQQMPYSYYFQKSMVTDPVRGFVSPQDVGYYNYIGQTKDASLQAQMRAQYPAEVPGVPFSYAAQYPALSYNPYYPMHTSVPIGDAVRLSEASMYPPANYAYPYPVDAVNSLQVMNTYGMYPTAIGQPKSFDMSYYSKGTVLKDLPASYGSAPYVQGITKTLPSETYPPTPGNAVSFNALLNPSAGGVQNSAASNPPASQKEKARETRETTQGGQKRKADASIDKNPKHCMFCNRLVIPLVNQEKESTNDIERQIANILCHLNNTSASSTPREKKESNKDLKGFASAVPAPGTHENGTEKAIHSAMNHEVKSEEGPAHKEEEKFKNEEFKIKNDHYHESLHIHCPTCHRRNGLKSVDYPKVIKCSSCGDTFTVIKKYIHGCVPGESIDPDDTSLELPCLRRQTDPVIRQKRLVDHYNTIINGRRCEQSTRIREIQKVMTSLINKVEKNVSKEQKHIQDECTSFINHLICSVEKYNSGVLYCKCFTPYFPQRHYIQCDVCDFWYHTSCVGIDSRKSSLIIEFVCPWCEKKTGKVTQYETPGDGLSSQRPPSQCPLCNRYFPRPCNLSRHLHARHKMKWSTHMILHMDVDNYLKQECFIPDEETKKKEKEKEQSTTNIYAKKYNKSLKNTEEQETNEENASGNNEESEEMEEESEEEETTNEHESDASPQEEKKLPLTKSNTRYLLRKLRSKPRQWWINKTLKVYKGPTEGYWEGSIKTIRPRNEMIIKYVNGQTETLVNLYDLKYNIKLPILRGTYELELAHAIPYPIQRDAASDIAIFVKGDIKCDKKTRLEFKNNHKMLSRRRPELPTSPAPSTPLPALSPCSPEEEVKQEETESSPTVSNKVEAQ